MTPVYRCTYCGKQANSVQSLTAFSCIRHPNGPGKGRQRRMKGKRKQSISVNIVGKSFLL